MYETIDELFAQTVHQIQYQDISQFTPEHIANMVLNLKKQVICTVAIGNQLPITQTVASLQNIEIFNQHDEIYSEAK